jgi:hypothetical protein
MICCNEYKYGACASVLAVPFNRFCLDHMPRSSAEHLRHAEACNLAGCEFSSVHLHRDGDHGVPCDVNGNPGPLCTRSRLERLLIK